MATTARIAATAAVGTYDASIAAGSTTTFAAFDLKAGEIIQILAADSGGNYSPINYLGPDGSPKSAELTSAKNFESITGPIDLRISKPATSSAVEVVEYS